MDFSPGGTRRSRSTVRRPGCIEALRTKIRAARSRDTPPAGGGHGKDRGGEALNASQFEWDPTLQDPRCVFQVLKRHFARYTPEMVEQHCGVPKEVFLKTCRNLRIRFRPGEDRGDLLRGGLDPAFQRRADHPLCGDSAAAAGQHRAARRRHSRPARPCLDSGLNRYPHTV